MKNSSLLLLLATLFFYANTVTAQKAKFKLVEVKTKKVRLPNTKIDEEYRTYAYSGYTYDEEPIKFTQPVMYGWTLNNSDPNVSIRFVVDQFSYGSPQLLTNKQDKKDKDGKVISSTTNYNYKTVPYGVGEIAIYGKKRPINFNPRSEALAENTGGKSKAELRREELAAKKNKKPKKNTKADELQKRRDELKANRKEDVVTKTVKAAIKESIENNETTPMVNGRLLMHSSRLNINKVFFTGWRSSVVLAQKSLEKQGRKINDFREAFPVLAVDSIAKFLNDSYGYTPYIYSVWMKEMKSEDHPEYEAWNNAIKASTALFTELKSFESIDSRQADFDPHVKYFQDLIENIPDSDKKGRKLRNAAYYNLSYLLLLLDRHEAQIELCDKYVDNKGMGPRTRYMKPISEEILKKLQFHELSARHIDLAEEEPTLLSTSETAKPEGEED